LIENPNLGDGVGRNFYGCSAVVILMMLAIGYAIYYSTS